MEAKSSGLVKQQIFPLLSLQCRLQLACEVAYVFQKCHLLIASLESLRPALFILDTELMKLLYLLGFKVNPDQPSEMQLAKYVNQGWCCWFFFFLNCRC